MHGLKSNRNAQRVLKQMEDLVNVAKDGENVYYLNANGRAVVGCDKVRKATNNLRHYIMRNYVYIAYNCPATWRNEIRIKNGSTKKDTVVCVADALFKRNNSYHIVEVDNTQTMANNRLKMDKYRTLVERGAFNGKPMFIWVTLTELRRTQLTELCKGFDVRVYTLADFSTYN